MSTSIRIFGAIAIVCIAALGMLYVFDFINDEFLKQNSLKLIVGLGILFAAVFGLRLLAAGRGRSAESDPPPTL